MKLPIQSPSVMRSVNTYQSDSQGISPSADTGSCTAAPNHQRKNCTMLSSNCHQGFLPHPGNYPGCQCRCI